MSHLDIVPTQDQSKAMEVIQDFIADPDRKSLKMNGPAGSGKTTLLKLIKSLLSDKCVVCAVTNKAVSVLRAKGFARATTLDRVLNKSIYTPLHRSPTKEEVEFYKEHGLELPAFIEEENYEKADNEDGGLLVCVDEASMTNMDDYVRLISLYKKVLFVGDDFQLPPVEGEQWFQTAAADIELTEIVRTASTSEITRAANFIRKHSPEWKRQDWQNEVTILQKTHRAEVDQAMKNADIVLAHKNDTCDEMNWRIREVKGLLGDNDETRPQVGEMLLAWDTKKEHGLYRSEIYEVEKCFPMPGGYRVRLKGLCGKQEFFTINRANLQQQKTTITVPGLLRFSYAHCITTYKSQGSEWENVVVLAYDHYSKFPDHWNWLYTAATRAKKHLTIVI